MTGFVARHSPKFFLAAALLGGGAAVFAVPEYLARSTEDVTLSCLEVETRDTRCFFVGGPLEMDGNAVYMENFEQAFFPTKQKIDFVDAAGQTWTAPPQTLTDGASIPLFLAPFVGDRQSREYVIAAALHDAYCGVGNTHLTTWQTRPWEDVHRMFYEALLVNGTSPQKAKIMFAAVYLGGPRWEETERNLEDVPQERLVKELEWCLEWIKREDPSLDRIVTWMTEREAALTSGDHVAPDYIQNLVSQDGM